MKIKVEKPKVTHFRFSVDIDGDELEKLRGEYYQVDGTAMPAIDEFLENLTDAWDDAL